MSDNPYENLDKLITDYEKLEDMFHPDSYLIQSYPKILVMSIASLFEVRIKGKITDFYNSPIGSLQRNYPRIYSIRVTPQESVSDKLYKKFYTTDCVGNEHLSAVLFYDFFGGTLFKSDVQTNYQTELSTRIVKITDMINKLEELMSQDSKYEGDYAKYSELKDKLAHCSFVTSELAFLSLKSRRNRVAHDYINGLSDTFNDIKSFYEEAVIYVMAIEKAISDRTRIC